MRETGRETQRDFTTYARVLNYSEIQKWTSVSASLFGKSTQAHNGST